MALATMDPPGVSGSCAVLRALGNSSPTALSQIVQATGLSFDHVRAALRALEEAGLAHPAPGGWQRARPPAPGPDHADHAWCGTVCVPLPAHLAAVSAGRAEPATLVAFYQWATLTACAPAGPDGWTAVLGGPALDRFRELATDEQSTARALLAASRAWLLARLSPDPAARQVIGALAGPGAGAISVRELAQRLGWPPRRAARVLARLERSGVVTRQSGGGRGRQDDLWALRS